MRIRPTFKSVFFGTVIYAAFFILFHLLIDGIPTSSKALAALIIPPVITGLILTLIMGFLMDKFVRKGHPGDAVKIDHLLQPDEKILFETNSNYFIKNLGGVGGKLFLTNKNLIFRSHKYNFKEEVKIIPLGEITSIKETKTLGIVNNGLRITLTNGRKEEFVLAERKGFPKNLSEPGFSEL